MTTTYVPWHDHLLVANVPGVGMWNWRIDMDRAVQVDMMVDFLMDAKEWEEGQALAAGREFGKIMAAHDAEV